MPITQKVLDEIMEDYKEPEDLLGEDGILNQLTKALVERALGSNLAFLLRKENHQEIERKSNSLQQLNSNNKKEKTSQNIQLKIVGNTKENFQSQLTKQPQKKVEGFDEKILSMYSKTMTLQEIKEDLQEFYRTKISSTSINKVLNKLTKETEVWQSRPLNAVYPIVYIDSLEVKVSSKVENKTVYLALGLNLSGNKEVLGMWVSENKDFQPALKIMTDLKNRGVEDIFLISLEQPKMFLETLESIFPKTQIQLSVIHVVRNVLTYVSYKDFKSITGDMKLIYHAATEKEAEIALEAFTSKWCASYPMPVQIWKNNWKQLRKMFIYPSEIRKSISTAYVIDPLNTSLRKISKHNYVFPDDESLLNLFYLNMKGISKQWAMPIRHWSDTINQFTLFFDKRVPLPVKLIS